MDTKSASEVGRSRRGEPLGGEDPGTEVRCIFWGRVRERWREKWAEVRPCFLSVSGYPPGTAGRSIKGHLCGWEEASPMPPGYLGTLETTAASGVWPPFPSHHGWTWRQKQHLPGLLRGVAPRQQLLPISHGPQTVRSALWAPDLCCAQTRHCMCSRVRQVCSAHHGLLVQSCPRPHPGSAEGSWKGIQLEETLSELKVQLQFKRLLLEWSSKKKKV